MDRKSKILFGSLAILIALSVSASYYRFMVLHDYVIEAEVDCEPAAESCFVWECDPEYEECTGDPEEDTWYYKFAYRNAKNIPDCDPAEEGCDAFVCTEGEAECEEVTCSRDTLLEYHLEGECTNPVDFIVETEEEIIDNTASEDDAVLLEEPVEEDSVEEEI